MKTRIIFITLLTAVGLLTSCDYDTIRADGKVTSVHHNFTGYSGLRISDTFNVYVTFSDTEEDIRIEANNNLHEKIVVETDGDLLDIRLKNHTSIQGRVTLNAYVKTRDLSTLLVSGASELTMENQWDVQNGKIYVSGASFVTGNVEANELEADVSGASTLDFYGNVSSLDVELSGSSAMRDYDLNASKLNIELSGASVAFLTVAETIDVEASGASVLNYKGGAEIIRSELSGSSKVIKKD